VLSPDRTEGWLGLLAQAGIHPASLLLCCQGSNAPLIEPLKLMLERLDPGFQLVPDLRFDTIIAWSPLTYAHEIDSWNLRPSGPLPDQLLTIRGLTLQGDPRVQRLGRDWVIVGRLRLLELPQLRSLPGPLELFGDLELDGLPQLRQLGPGITVHGNLTVAGCPALGGLPEDLRVAGAVWMDAAGPGFRASPALAERIASPWPGLEPAPVAMTALPAGILELGSQ
jgi:hypothetical protein